MAAFISPIADRTAQAFSWMLIHSLWQGLVVSLLLCALLRLMANTPARVKYLATLSTFFAFLVICAITFLREWDLFSAVPEVITRTSLTSGPGTWGWNLDSFFNNQTVSQSITRNTPVIILFWMVAFLFKSTRLILSITTIHKLKHQQLSPPIAYWSDRISELAAQLRFDKAVRLLESGLVKVPMVIGHLKPIILVPAGLLTSLPAEQIEAVLLHELAHIRRNDYLVNFIQVITEAIFCFNPALLWISSALREQREHCCDDIALESTSNKNYVAALISFNEHALKSSGMAVAFPGRKDQLLKRVRRILVDKRATTPSADRVFILCSILLALTFLFTWAFTNPQRRKEIASNITPYIIPVERDSFMDEVIPVPENSGIQLRSVPPKATSKKDKIITLQQQREYEMLTIDTAVVPPGPATEGIDRKQAIQQTQAVLYSAQAKRDQHQVFLDQQQAMKDIELAKLDQQRALKDQEQARRDQERAKLDQEQAKKDQARAKLDQIQAAKDQQQARKDQEQAKKDQERALLDQEQARKDIERAREEQYAGQQNTNRARRGYKSEYQQYTQKWPEGG